MSDNDNKLYEIGLISDKASQSFLNAIGKLNGLTWSANRLLIANDKPLLVVMGATAAAAIRSVLEEADETASIGIWEHTADTEDAT